MVSPGRSDDSAVCCMCGDHGLPQELFRCQLCRLRLQHRYCSELYPRAATYRWCNWCISEDGGRGGSPAKRRMSMSSEMNNSKGDKRIRRSCGATCSRSVFSTDQQSGKPVKKPKDIADDGVVLPVPEAETTTAKYCIRRPRAAAGKKARFRVKVRRYKLLAEVISC